jgi:NTP pyrophosphatase (non-canonical NTP hydrolase)
VNTSVISLADVCRQAHAVAKSKGWWEESRTFGDFCALFHTEISEAVEAYRKSGKVDAHVIEELGDVIIRIGDFIGGHGLTERFVEALVHKMVKNTKRSHRHGGKKL